MTVLVTINDPSADCGCRIYVVKRVTFLEDALDYLYSRNYISNLDRGKAILTPITEKVTVICE